MENNRFPSIQFIKLSSTETQWRMLTNGLVRQISFKGIVERLPGVKVSVSIKITKIIPPENQTNTASVSLKDDTLPEIQKNGVEKIEEFLANFYQKRKWLMFGVVEGKIEKNIIIIYYEDFDLAIYSLKPNEETIEKFMPPGMSLN